MRKLLSIMLAVSTLISFTACGTKKENENDNGGSNSMSVEKLSGVSYKKERLNIAENMNQVYCFNPYNSMNDYLLLGSGSKTPEFWHANADLSEYQPVEFSEFDMGVNYNVDVAESGVLAELVIHADYGNLPPINIYDPPEDYDEKKYDAAAEYSLMINTFSANGQLLSSAVIEEPPVEPDKSTNIGQIFTDGNILIAELNGSYELFSLDGKYLGELNSGDEKIDEIGHDCYGNIICSVSYKKDEESFLKFCKINSDGTLTDYNNTEYQYSGAVSALRAGNSDYSIFLMSRSHIYGVRKDDNSMECIFDLNSSGINVNLLEGFLMMDDGNMALMYNTENWTLEFKKFIPRTQEEIDNLKILTIGVEDTFAISEYVNQWNDEGHDFIIELKTYNTDYENAESTIGQLEEDILQGNMPDMIFMYFNEFCGVNLAEKGALENLYPYIDSDKEISRDTFVPNVLECFEKNDSLYTMPDRFILTLGDIAKQKFVSPDTEWNIDKDVDIAIATPIDTTFNEDTKYNRWSSLDFTDWIDIDNAECHYTDESFIKYLNFCNEADTVKSRFQLMTEEEWYQYVESEEFQKYQEEARKYAYLDDLAYIDDTKIKSFESLSTYSNYHQLTKGKFGGEPLTFLEKPYLEPYGQLGICTTSENKELCWEFVKSRISDEYYKATIDYAPFPVTKTGLKLSADNEFNCEYNNNYNGHEELKDYDGDLYTICKGDDTKDWDFIKIGRITQKEIDEVNDIIANAVPHKSSARVNNTVYQILDEEVLKFFNGEYTAEKCAEIIQSRLSVYLAEVYG